MSNSLIIDIKDNTWANKEQWKEAIKEDPRYKAFLLVEIFKRMLYVTTDETLQLKLWAQERKRVKQLEKLGDTKIIREYK